MMKIAAYILHFLTSLGSLYGVPWDVEYWQYFKGENGQSGPYNLSTTAEIRFNRDISRIYYYRIAENFTFRASPCVDLGAHYSYIYSQSKGAAQFTHTSRFEFELNPFFTLRSGISLKWRNRLELLKKQQVSSMQWIARHRPLISIPIENGTALSAVHVYDEIFYDFDISKFIENRFIPIELAFILHQKFTLNVFVMFRHFYASEKWYRSIVLGTEAGF
jgi:hypothetical protein